LFSSLRERSGLLPSGRSVFGTLVDPLGLWRTSPAVQLSELDKQTISTTRNLIQLLQKRSVTDGDSIDVASLSNDEVVGLSRTLIRKIWDRRISFAKIGRRLAAKLIDLTADKLQEGERPAAASGILDDRGPNAATGILDDRGPTAATGILDDRGPTAVIKSSSRIDKARRLLAELENRKRDVPEPKRETTGVEKAREVPRPDDGKMEAAVDAGETERLEKANALLAELEEEVGPEPAVDDGESVSKKEPEPVEPEPAEPVSR